MPTSCESSSVDDIEDLGLFNDHEEVVSAREGNVTARRRKQQLSGDGDHVPQVESFLPEAYKVYVKTWGCTHNSSDSEYMAGLLAANGYNITENKEIADLWLLNSCTVKTPAEDHFKNEIKAANTLNKPLVVAGCVPQGAPKSDFLKNLSIIGVQQIDKVVEVVEETLKGNTVRFLGEKKEHGKKMGGATLLLPKIRKNPLIEIIPINTGCLNQCTYCKTKHARGRLGSYPIEMIVARAEQAFQEGVCELWLTSEDTGAYGRDIGVTLPQLLWKIVDVIPDGCMMRLGMTNPPYILEHMLEMAAILSHPHVYSFLHIPVQSGSDGVLGDMKREYTRAEFEILVDCLRQQVPGISIATDLICGFPTETEQDFEETLSLVRKYKFPSLFINQFYPRPGTPAAKMERIPTQETKRRSRVVSELFNSYHPYEGREGEVSSILITEVSKDQKHCVGHNKFYEQVLVPYDESLMGKLVTVRVTSTGKHYLMAAVLGVPAITPSIAKPLEKGVLAGANRFFSDEAHEEEMRKMVDRPAVPPMSPSAWLNMVVFAFAFVIMYRLLRALYRNTDWWEKSYDAIINWLSAV